MTLPSRAQLFGAADPFSDHGRFSSREQRFEPVLYANAVLDTHGGQRGANEFPFALF